MKRFFVIAIIFFTAFLLSFYGASIFQKDSDDYPFFRPNLFQITAMATAIPGDIAVTLFMNPTDIPERSPDPWPIRWYSSPISAAFWTLLFYGTFATLKLGLRRLRKRPNQAIQPTC